MKIREMTGRNRSQAGRRFACIAAFALAFAGLPAGAWATTAGVVIAVTGKPKVQPAGSKSLKAVKTSQFVDEGDTIRTGKGEQVAIAFVGGAELRINENSVFELESGGGQRTTSVRTMLGQAWTRLLHGRAGMEIRSPMAVCSVRGTEGEATVDERSMTVKNYEGRIDLTTSKGTQSLPVGTMSQAVSGMAPTPPKKMSAQDLGAWQKQIKLVDVDKNVQRLNEAADKERTLEMQIDKNGVKKTIKLKFQKKQQ